MKYSLCLETEDYQEYNSIAEAIKARDCLFYIRTVLRNKSKYYEEPGAGSWEEAYSKVCEIMSEYGFQD